MAVVSLPAMGNLTGTLGQLTQLEQGVTGMVADTGNADAAAAEAKPFLAFKFGTVFTTKIDWSGSSEHDSFVLETSEPPTATEYGKDGAKGGNVEFEWKVEEGESSGDVFDFTGAADTGTASVDTFSKTFTITIVSGGRGDAFDFTAMADSEAAGSRAGSVKVFICSAVPRLNGDDIDDVATYLQIDPASDGLPDVPVVDLQINLQFETLI